MSKIWHGCYNEGWTGGKIQPESFAHPAKFAYGVITRIYEYALERGYFKAGQTILDAFGGVALGALAVQYGLNWVGQELEQYFVDMGAGCQCTGISQAEWVRFYGRWKRVNYREGRHWCPRCLAQAEQTIEEQSAQLRLFGNAASGASYVRNSGRIPSTNAHQYAGNLELFSRYATGDAWAMLVQGDSRYLAQNLEGLGEGLVSSPPYANGCAHTGGKDSNPEKITGGTRTVYGADYGSSPGQLGLMPEGLVGSPPYAAQTVRGSNGIDPDKIKGRKGGPNAQLRVGGYGATPGQLGEMAEGLVSSPPYEKQQAGGGIATALSGEGDYRLHPGIRATDGRKTQGYRKQGGSEGQLASLSGGFDHVVSSPPFENSLDRGRIGPGRRVRHARQKGISNAEHISPIDMEKAGKRDQPDYGKSDGQLGAMSGGFDHVVSSPPFTSSVGSDDPDRRGGLFRDPKRRADRNLTGEYGQSEGQLANEPPQSFWQAARQVVEQCYLVLAPGAYTFWVTKAFVRKHQIVDFPGQWKQLCESCGFEFVEEIRAMLVTEKGIQLDWNGKHVRHTVERKSFFRRLAENKGSPRIDWETVLILRKPL